MFSTGFVAIFQQKVASKRSVAVHRQFQIISFLKIIYDFTAIDNDKFNSLSLFSQHLLYPLVNCCPDNKIFLHYLV